MRSDRGGPSEAGAVSLSKSVVGLATSVDPAVLSDRRVLGWLDWTAKRGAQALGIEYNPDMVKLSRHNAENAGVADRA